MLLGEYSADAFGVARGSSNKCAWGKARLAAVSSQMNREPEPKIIRRTFAKRITAAGGVSNPRVEAAFAVVAREDFHRARAVADRALGRRLSHDAGFRPGLPTPTDVIGILPERNLNNGPPSIHAALIAAATAPQLGEQVVHLGAGVGYYTAILAELIGATGGG